MRRWRGAYALIPSRGSVDTHGQIIVTEAGLEDAGVIVAWHVPAATHFIVDVLAVACGIGPSLNEISVINIGHAEKLRSLEGNVRKRGSKTPSPT